MRLFDGQLLYVERAYAWGLAEFEREILGQFPILKRVRHPTVRAFLSWAQTLSDEELIEFARELINFRLDRILSALHFSVVSRAKRQATAIEPSPGSLVSRYITYIQSPEMLASGTRMMLSRSSLSRSRIASSARKAVAHILGSETPDSGRLTWSYCSCIGNWNVMTHIDVGGRTQEIFYNHSVISSDQRHELGPSDSIVSLYGLTGGGTSWGGLTPDNIDDATDCLAAVCERFMQVVPDWLQGIDVPDSG